MKTWPPSTHPDQVKLRVAEGRSWMCAKSANLDAATHLMCNGRTGHGRVARHKPLCTCPCHQEALDAE